MKPAGVQEWGLARRTGAVARNGTKLLGVGFFASLFGVTITNVLVKVLFVPLFDDPSLWQGDCCRQGAAAERSCSLRFLTQSETLP